MWLKDWTDEHTQKFRNEALTAQHKLSETGLFTDEALADLLDRHPRSELDICTIADHDVYQAKFRTGDAGDADGATLIEAAKSGAIWMNLRRAMNLHEDYKKVLDGIYGELSDSTGNRALNPRGGILITCPTAQTPYHCDPTETILWHVRGHKRFYLYPRKPKYLPDEGYERVLYCDNEDYLPYDETFEDEARCFDLTGDDMISWPLNAPHRVENKSFCVSVTTEYSTMESTLKNAVMYTNAVLRQKFGMSPDWRSASWPEKAVKAGAGRVMRKFGVLSSMKQTDMVTFKVSRTAPGYIHDTTPYPRPG